MNKEQVLLYLKRVLKDYEPMPVDHESITYEERQRRIKAFEKDNPEAVAIHIALDLVDKFYHVKY